MPRTPWGHPDLQGLWNNSTTTPLEAMTAEYPNFAPAYRYLGLFYEGQNRMADSERARERFAEIVGFTPVD